MESEIYVLLEKMADGGGADVGMKWEFQVKVNGKYWVNVDTQSLQTSGPKFFFGIQLNQISISYSVFDLQWWVLFHLEISFGQHASYMGCMWVHHV